MRRALTLAIRHHVAIGAHPGTQDLVGFGRRRMELSPEEIENICIYQIGALEAFAKVLDTKLSHVKPHGWLYNEAAINLELALAIARAVRAVSDRLVLFGLSGSQLIKAAQQIGLPFAQEAFIDRTYQSDGNLTPRSVRHALITDPEQAAQQALDLVLQGRVECADGENIPVHADTLCLHGDNPEVVNVLIQVRKKLLENGVEIAPLNA